MGQRFAIGPLEQGESVGQRPGGRESAARGALVTSWRRDPATERDQAVVVFHGPPPIDRLADRRRHLARRPDPAIDYAENTRVLGRRLANQKSVIESAGGRRRAGYGRFQPDHPRKHWSPEPHRPMHGGASPQPGAVACAIERRANPQGDRTILLGGREKAAEGTLANLKVQQLHSAKGKPLCRSRGGPSPPSCDPTLRDAPHLEDRGDWPRDSLKSPATEAGLARVCQSTHRHPIACCGVRKFWRARSGNSGGFRERRAVDAAGQAGRAGCGEQRGLRAPASPAYPSSLVPRSCRGPRQAGLRPAAAFLGICGGDARITPLSMTLLSPTSSPVPGSIPDRPSSSRPTFPDPGFACATTGRRALRARLARARGPG
jgi:hypothetical protein